MTRQHQEKLFEEEQRLRPELEEEKWNIGGFKTGGKSLITNRSRSVETVETRFHSSVQWRQKRKEQLSWRVLTRHQRHQNTNCSNFDNIFLVMYLRLWKRNAGTFRGGMEIWRRKGNLAFRAENSASFKRFGVHQAR